jgi:hypothetical protein
VGAAQAQEEATSMRQVAATEMDQNQLVEAQKLALQQTKGAFKPLR